MDLSRDLTQHSQGDNSRLQVLPFCRALGIVEEGEEGSEEVGDR